MKDGTEHVGHLMRSLMKKWRAVMDGRLAHLGMSEARWQCLLHLGRNAASLPQVELAEAMGITPPSLVKLLDRLELDGWVERLPEPQDRRAKRVALTEKAHALVQFIEAEAQQLRQEIWEGVTPTQRQAFLQMLQHLERKMDVISLNPSTTDSSS
jgi:MarR family transcriptional regulator for hemolysin